MYREMIDCDGKNDFRVFLRVFDEFIKFVFFKDAVEDIDDERADAVDEDLIEREAFDERF